MTATPINLPNGQKVERKLLVTYINVGTGDTKEWEIMGRGETSSTIEFAPDIVTETDILGITETTVNKFEESQSFETNTLRGGQKLNEKLLDIVNRRAYSELSNFELMRASFMLGTTSFNAIVDTGCTISPESLGGESYIDMPITLYFSGKRTHGTVDKKENPTFTEKTTGGI